MNPAKKVYKAIFGLFLSFSYAKVFDLSLFHGKRVAVIGSAASAFDEEMGAYIDTFDYVIRINKAPYALNEQNKIYLGTKTDILFHSFYENTHSGGGPLDVVLFNSMGIQYLITPRNTYQGWRLIFNFYKKYLHRYAVYMLPRDFYKNMMEDFGIWKPTMGYCALYTIINSNFSECYLTGFTFFRTPYASGYRDELINMDKNKEHIKSQGIHDPDLEFELFIKSLKENNHKNIKMDTQLTAICSASI
jgi:hypothetical protein